MFHCETTLAFCRNRKKKTLKLTQDHKGSPKYKVLERKMKLESSRFLTLKHCTMILKSPNYHKNMEDLGQQNRKPRKNPAEGFFVQTLYNEKRVVSSTVLGKQQSPHLIPHYSKLKWIVDLNMRSQAIFLIEENKKIPKHG